MSVEQSYWGRLRYAGHVKEDVLSGVTLLSPSHQVAHLKVVQQCRRFSFFETYLSPNTLLQVGDDRIFGQKFIISSQAEQPAELERTSIYSFFRMCCIIVDCIYPLRMGRQWVKRTVRMQSGSCDRGKPDHKSHLNNKGFCSLFNGLFHLGIHAGPMVHHDPEGHRAH